MKIGFETIIWGMQINDLKYALDIIAEAGYQGVEFAQRPDALGVNNIDELLKLLKERNLTLLSFVGGTLDERMAFCGDFRPEYMYVEHSDLKSLPEAIQRGFIPSLHLRVFTPLRRYTDALPILEKHPEMKLLLDTAHLTIAGDNPANAIQHAGDRLVGVHFKDWTPEFGRSSYRYGRGFTELGEGIVELDSALEELRKINYEGWVVAELDRSQTSPQQSVFISATWLAKRGLLSKPPNKITKIAARRNWILSSRQDSKYSPEAEARFREIIGLASAYGAETFYDWVAAAFHELIPCHLVTVWACSPAQDHMGVLAITPATTLLSESHVLNLSKALTGIAINRQAPATHFDLTKAHPGEPYGFPDRRFAHPNLQREMGLKRMVSVPIYNFGNQNYVRLIVSLFPHDEELPVTDEEMYWFARAVTIAADSMLERLCSSAAVKVNILAGECENVQEFLKELINLIQKSLNCEGVTIFLVNEVGDRLEVAETTGIHWTVPEHEQFYKKGEGLTGEVWKRNEPSLSIHSPNEFGHMGKSGESVQNPKRDACLWVPFVDSGGKVIGVVRCRNKLITDTTVVPNMFSDDDAAVLDAIGQAAVPHLQLMMDKERRAKALARLTHELRVPVVAIRAATELMLHTKGVEGFFDHNYPENIWSWSELMRRLLGNADLFRYSSEGLPTRVEPTLLMAHVVAPAVNQVTMLLQERGFSANRIKYEQFEQIPRLWIDRNQFQQVIFNLLSNAIKYCYDDPSSFAVEIEGEKRDKAFVIKFCDWGPGIERGLEEAIFGEGFRTPGAAKRNVTGDGLGLWVVRQVIEAHGGTIKVTKRHLPTEFTIYLPRSLVRRPSQ